MHSSSFLFLVVDPLVKSKALGHKLWVLVVERTEQSGCNNQQQIGHDARSSSNVPLLFGLQIQTVQGLRRAIQGQLWSSLLSFHKSPQTGQPSKRRVLCSRQRRLDGRCKPHDTEILSQRVSSQKDARTRHILQRGQVWKSQTERRPRRQPLHEVSCLS